MRVTLIDGAPKAYRVRSRNLSLFGMFLEMPMPVEAGTRVALSLEAGDRVLPFAQGVVVWQREFSNPSLARQAGFAVKFTGFLHPRANEMVRYLCDAIGTGKLLTTASRRAVWRKRAISALLVASVAVVTFTVVNALVAPIAQSDAQVTQNEVQRSEGAEPDPIGEASTIATHTELANPSPVSPTEAREASTSPARTEPEAPEHSIAIPSGAATALNWDSANDEFRVSPALGANAVTSKIYLLSDPPRLVFDIDGAAPVASHSLQSGERLFQRIRVGRQAKATRVVVDLARDPKSFIDEDGAAIVSF